jgi:hypothetical protein
MKCSDALPSASKNLRPEVEGLKEFPGGLHLKPGHERVQVEHNVTPRSSDERCLWAFSCCIDFFPIFPIRVSICGTKIHSSSMR